MTNEAVDRHVREVEVSLTRGERMLERDNVSMNLVAVFRGLEALTHAVLALVEATEAKGGKSAREFIPFEPTGVPNEPPEWKEAADDTVDVDHGADT